MLVCSNERDKDFKPKPLYNNRKMREFFGKCLVNPKKKIRDIVSQGKVVRRQTTFEKRLFSLRQNVADLNEESKVFEEKKIVEESKVVNDDN